jgi:hypothetical protein
MDATLDVVSRETLEAIAKATTEGVLVSTGIQGYDLSGLVALVPVNVPARNNTSAFPRTIAGTGSQTAVWRALLNINAQQSDAATGMDFAGSLVKFDEQDCFAPYRPLAKGGRVTLDAVAVARNFADALAVAELQTLNQLFIAQDMHLINSQAWTLGAKPTAPTLVVNKTGGSLAESTKYEVQFAARSGANYFVGGSTEPSAAATAKTEALKTNTITASHAAIKGAVAYDWYFGTESGKLWYYTTTTIAEATFTEALTKANGVPGAEKCPLLWSTIPAKEAAEIVTDTSFNEKKWFNGVIASTLGDYGSTGPVKPGAGTSSGAYWKDNKGAKITASGASVPLLDELFAELWASTQLSPTGIMLNALQGDELSTALLENSTSTTFLPPTDADARTNLAGGGYVGRYINKAAGGVPVSIEIHPHVAPGTLIARTDRVPFPGSNIGTVFEMRCQYDTMRFDYAASRGSGEGEGPRYDFEIRSMETLINRAPSAQGIVSNIG